MNKYIFNGNLGRDAEVRTTQSGKVVCRFSVAVQEGYGDNQRTKWVKCSLFGKRAEGDLPQYLTSGTRVLVTGNPQADAWTDTGSGEAKGQLSVLVDEVELLSSSSDSGSKGQPQPQRQQPANTGFPPPTGQPAPRPAQGFDDFDDDLPY